MFKDQPKGLFALALANTGERFGYYTMLAIFLLFIQAKFGFSAAVSTQIYSIFLAAVYFMPLFGGMSCSISQICESLSLFVSCDPANQKVSANRSPKCL